MSRRMPNGRIAFGSPVKKPELSTEAAFGCCFLLAVYFIGAAIAVAVSVVDLVQGRTHLWLDVLLLVLFALPMLRGRVAW